MLSLEDELSEINSEIAEIVRAMTDMTEMIHKELPELRGKTKEKNIYGELQSRLDIWTNQIMVEKLRNIDSVKRIFSEELRESVEKDNGRYTIGFDPLDGSSNIESNNLFGTIVGIYDSKREFPIGRELVASFYILYGPTITVTLATDRGVDEFIKHWKKPNKFLACKEKATIPEPGKIFGPGGAPNKWTPEYRKFMDYLFSSGRKFRYTGAFVGDVNQVLEHGGYFGYPALIDKPEGKLRLMIECNQMAYIIEQAGGASSNGKHSILDVKTEKIDQRTPLHIGNREIIKELEKIYKA